MTGDPERERLDQLAARIREAEQAPKAAPEPPFAENQALKAGRVGFDFIATVLVCIGLGWVIDHYAETGPWGMLIMMFVGFAAGMFNIVRALNAKK